MSRYNSFEDHQHDVQFTTLERRVRNLEALIGGTGPGLRSQIIRIPGDGTNYTSTTYVDVPGLTFTFNKLSSATLLRVRFEVSGFTNVAGTVATFGVDVVASNTIYTDYDVAPYFFNTTGDHRHWSYARDVPDDSFSGTFLASGDLTVYGRVKVNANQYTANSSDLLLLEVTEVEAY